MIVRLASRFLWREAKSGELSLIFMALVLAVTSATAIALFSARLDLAMQQRSNDLLGADLRIESTVPIDTFWQESAENIGLRSTVTTHFPTMVLADRKSTRLNSSHVRISYAVFCLKKK